MPLKRPDLPKLKPVVDKVIDPQRIRALMTGVGQTQQRSEVTGHERAERVLDCMPPKVASKSSGFPSRDEDMMEGMGMGYRRPSLDGALNYTKRR